MKLVLVLVVFFFFFLGLIIPSLQTDLGLSFGHGLDRMG